MATAQDVIDAGTLWLGRRPAGTAFNTHNSSLNAECFKALQDLISQLAANNCLHIPAPSATTDVLDIYEEQLRALKYLATRDFVAVLRVAQVNPVVLRNIEAAENELENDNNISLELDMPLKWSHKYDIASDV